MDALQPPAAPFLASPVVTDLNRVEADFAVIGIPYGSPYNMQGVHSDAANAPTVFRERSRRFSRQLQHYDFDLGGTLFGDTGARLVDCGDLVGDPRDAEGNKRRATESVRALLDQGAVPVVLGGDDSIPPLVAGAFEGHRPIQVLQIDAHLDFRDEVHGIRDGYSSPMRRISEMPWVGRVVQVGLRGVGSARPSDVTDARAAGHVLITAEQVHTHGPQLLLDQLDPVMPCFLTLDVDGLDPSIAPGTSVPLPDGLTFRQASAVFRGVPERCGLAGIDVVEHFPSLDVNNITSVTIARLLMNLLAAAARQLHTTAPRDTATSDT